MSVLGDLSLNCAGMLLAIFNLWLILQVVALRVRVDELERKQEKPKRDLTAPRDFSLYVDDVPVVRADSEARKRFRL